MNHFRQRRSARRILAACGVVAAAGLLLGAAYQELAAQSAPATPARLDVPFTLNVRTSHVEWGKPLPGPPIRAFVVPSASEGRTLVELAERLALDFDTVMIDEAWDVNTWTVGTDEHYEERNYKLAYQYLEEDLAKPAAYDVIVLPGLFGWNRLPQSVRESIRRRVEQGTGLVLIHPTTGLPAPDDPKVEGPLNDFAPDRAVAPGEDLWNLSPLVGVLSDRIDARGFREVRPDAVETGPWKRLANHFVTSNVPLEAFPADVLEHYRYRLGKDSAALVTGEAGEPIVATKTFGKGRVVALGYLNTGLSPRIPWTVRGKLDDRWWEYFYSLLCRSLVWAAGREAGMSLGPLEVKTGVRQTLAVRVENATPLASAEVMAEVWNEWGGKEGSAGATLDKLKRGANSASVDLPARLAAGRHFVDVILTAEGKHYDWGTASFEVAKADEIASLTTDREFYARGDPMRVAFKTRLNAPGDFRVELLDNRGRLIARANSSGGMATLTVGNYSTLVGWVRVSLLTREGGSERLVDRKQARVNFLSPDRQFGAYELILPWYGPPSYQPWTPALDEQFRKIGVTAVEDPARNFKIISEVHAPGFGVYWHYRKNYLEQKDKFLETGDKRYLIREPDLASEAWLEKLRGTIRDSMAKDKAYAPLAYYLADESSLTAYGDPLDFSWSEPTLEKFRVWLRSQYSNLEALNSEWETQFKNWNEVVPLTTSEAQAKGNYAGWMDHRTFMEQVFASAVRVAAETVKREDPGGLPSISGTQAPGPSNAVNWYLLDQIVDYLQPYSEDDQDELHRTMNPGQILTGFTGYERHGAALRHELWHRLLHGQTGASLFWHYTALNADLTLTEQGRDLAATLDEFRDEGLAWLLRGATRENCGIAVHYSLPSVRGQWITDGRIAPHEVSNGDSTSPHLKRFHQNRSAWLLALEDAGYQYDFLTTEQIEAGKLPNYRVLILPDSIALSDGEAEAIREFVHQGGLLITDTETGLMDGHARWQAAGRLDDVLGVQRLATRSDPEQAAPVTLRLLLNNRNTEISVTPANASLRGTTGQPGASAAASLLLIDHRYGGGRALTLNIWMTDYPGLRKEGKASSRRELLHDVLARAGVAPLVEARRASGEPLACSEVLSFRKTHVQYLAILPEPGCADARGVTLTLPHPAFVYDLRAHRQVGHVTQVTGNPALGEPLLYGLAPAPLGRLSFAGNAEGPLRVKAGESAKLSLRWAAARGEVAPDTAVYVVVRDPAGKLIDYYSRTIAVSNGAAEFEIPTALDERPGVWRVTVREPFARQAASTTLAVSR